MVELAYSFHIGNDKNKTKKAKQKNTPTNYNNNAIQNAMQLSKVNHHNLRQYDNNPEKIKTLYGSNDIVKDVKELYKQEFEEARLEYNSKQTRDDRKIKDYYSKISNDTKHDLAKVANATIHFDESSPHLHIVGIAVKDNCKTGMIKQAGKCSVFTKDNLPKIQDKMRDNCIESFNKEYGLNAVLKDKQKGRNIDYRVSQMADYDELKKNYNQQRQKINQLNNQTKSLNTKSEEIKDIISNLKNQPLSNKNLLLSNQNKDKIIDYIEEVSKSTNDFKEITNYSLSVDKIKEDFKENHNSIEDLRKRVKLQNEEINDLRYDLNNKDNEISSLKSKIKDLKDSLDYWKDRFQRVVNFIHDKIHGIFGVKNEKYKEMADNLFINGIMNEKEYTSVINKKEKNRDDFER